MLLRKSPVCATVFIAYEYSVLRFKYLFVLPLLSFLFSDNVFKRGTIATEYLCSFYLLNSSGTPVDVYHQNLLWC